MSCSLGSLESSKAHIWHGNVFSTRHSVDSLLRSCSQDVRAGAHPESAEAAQLEEVGRRARRRAAPRPPAGGLRRKVAGDAHEPQAETSLFARNTKTCAGLAAGWQLVEVGGEGSRAAGEWGCF